MVRLNVPLTIRSGLRLLILAGIASAAFQTAKIAAQDSLRSGKSRGDDASRNRDDRGRVEKRRGFAEDDRRERFSFSGDNRRTDFNRADRKAQPKFFREGKFESQPTDKGFVFVNGEFLPRPYTFRASGKLTFVKSFVFPTTLTTQHSLKRL